MKCMLGRIPKVNFEKCYPTRLKRFFKASFGYKNYDAFVPNAKNKVVGNLPNEIINLWDKKDREYNIKLFQRALSNMTTYLRACYKKCKAENIISYDFNDLDPENLKILEKDFTKFFNKLLKDIVPDNIKVDLSYISRGCWGNVFKLVMYDKHTKQRIMHDKAFKVFHSIKCPVKELSNSQGVYAEANFWTYLETPSVIPTRSSLKVSMDGFNGHISAAFVRDFFTSSICPKEAACLAERTHILLARCAALTLDIISAMG